MTGPAGWLFQNYTSTVYHHEMGHVWGATDEYHPDAAQSPTLLVGYFQAVNANSQYNDGTGYFGGAGESISALMINNVDYVSPWTRGQWGTWDLDGDGINDTQDTLPTVVLNAPSGSSTLAFTATASVTPLLRETGTYANADISVNRIAHHDQSTKIDQIVLRAAGFHQNDPSDFAVAAASVICYMICVTVDQNTSGRMRSVSNGTTMVSPRRMSFEAPPTSTRPFARTTKMRSSPAFPVSPPLAAM